MRIYIPRRELEKQEANPKSFVGGSLEVRIAEWHDLPTNPHFCADFI